ncbi:hypothetical protein Adt_33140 [Abeliophyllum distichum]|uniref:Uncharacterized protein n=1 Tax=Abeliophyllum distichum TaxID=126358 RepID=A0ABD1QZ06_9LAMI
MVAIEKKVLHDLEKFKKHAAEKDKNKKKVVATVQSLLDKATMTSNKKDASDEALSRYKMSTEYQTSLHMYGEESLKAAINMTKEWLVDDHSEISPNEFDKYLKKCWAADLSAHKASVTDHGEASCLPDG